MFYPEVTILIPIRNVAKFIKECLDALLSQDYPQEKFEVWLLDNYSDDGTLEIVKRYPSDKVKVFQLGIDPPAIKYNLVLPKVKTTVVGLVDGDAIMDKHWLSRVVQPLSDKKTAGASGMVYTRNTDSLIARVVGYDLEERYYRLPREIKSAATMHTVYKTDVLRALGGFNEKLKTGYDCEIGYRINEAGYKIIFVREAKVFHYHRASLKSYFRQHYEYGKFAFIRCSQKTKYIKGDELAPFSMALQPFAYLFILLFLALSFLTALPFWFSFLPILLLLFIYLYTALRISLKHRDFSALFLVVVCFVRSFAWTLGAGVSCFRIIFRRTGRK